MNSVMYAASSWAWSMPSPSSLIAARILSRTKVDIDGHFFQERILSALQRRSRLFPIKMYTGWFTVNPIFCRVSLWTDTVAFSLSRA